MCAHKNSPEAQHAIATQWCVRVELQDYRNLQNIQALAWLPSVSDDDTEWNRRNGLVSRRRFDGGSGCSIAVAAVAATTTAATAAATVATTTATTSATTVAAAATTATRFAGLGFVDGQPSPIVLVLVQA